MTTYPLTPPAAEPVALSEAKLETNARTPPC